MTFSLQDEFNLREYSYTKKSKSEIESLNFTQYVCFKLNNQEFGLEVENVIEVLPPPEITPVVHTPDFIKGVINLRGQIIAIIDLRIFFYLESKAQI